jgi:cytochrome o ubiquinol oxidase subunit 2
MITPKCKITRNSSQIATHLIRLAKYLSIVIVIFGLTGCKSLLDGILNPKGIIAYEQRKLFFDSLALMLIVVLPVIIMSITFVYHYQASHKIRDYKPNWSHSYFLESLWWGIPCVITVILAVLTWNKTHELDPYNKIAGSNEAPLLIQVIALPWKWLFIYPEQGIASINYLEIPVGRDVEYWITTDNTPMSAFFIPQLGGQIYTMTGMRTRMHLLANQTGDFVGMNTNFSGDGFSDMKFVTHAVTPAEFSQWSDQVKLSPNHLTDDTYKLLVNPTVANAPEFFTDVTPDLFQRVLNIYMNSSGPIHPRNDQLKLNNVLN